MLASAEAIAEVELKPTSYLCGLLGHGISNSRSPEIYESEAAALGLRLVYRIIDFDRFGADESALPEVLQAAERFGFTGLNVTHPYKQHVMPLLDELSEMARGVGAVNTIVFRGAKRIGYNTDASGFWRAFQTGLPGETMDDIVQVGAGGAGSATAFALLRHGAGRIGMYDVDTFHRHALVDNLRRHFGPERAYAIDDADQLSAAVAGAKGIVQTSPVGMTGHDGSPIPLALLRPSLWLVDIIYFPEETTLLKAARELGCRALNGERMVVLQAADAFHHYTGMLPDIDRMLRRFKAGEC